MSHDSTFETPTKIKIKGPRTRANSQRSVASTLDGHAEEIEPETIKDLVKAARRVINNLKKSNKDVSETAVFELSVVLRYLSKIEIVNSDNQIEHTRNETTTEHTLKRLDEQRKFIETMSERIPQPKDIEHAVAEGIARNIHILQQQIETQLKDNVMALVPVETTEDVNQTSTQPESRSESTSVPRPASPSFSRQHQKPKRTHPDRRTLVIRALIDSTGNNIAANLQKIYVPNGLVEYTTPRRKCVEITCTTTDNKETLKRLLQQEREFNRAHTILDLPIKLHRLILPRVSDVYDADYIKSSFLQTFEIPMEEVELLHSYQNKRGGKNWLLRATYDLARFLVDSDGLYIGPNYVHIRPYTSIQRCRKCQELGHLEKQCRNPQKCDKCGQTHAPDVICPGPTCCINCKQHNESHDTRYSTNHCASATDCKTYKVHFNQERDRINELFGLLPRHENHVEKAPLLPTPDFPFLHRQENYMNFPPFPDPRLPPWMAQGNPHFNPC